MTCFPLHFSRLAPTSLRRSVAPVRSSPPLETATVPPRELRRDRQRRRQSSLSVMNAGDQACPETRPCPHPSPGGRKPARTLAGKVDGTDVLLGNVESQHRHAAHLSTHANGIAERWVGSCRRDLLDHVIAINERHLKRLPSRVRFLLPRGPHASWTREGNARWQNALSTWRSYLITAATGWVASSL